jgi:hypothetical protein
MVNIITFAASIYIVIRAFRSVETRSTPFSLRLDEYGRADIHMTPGKVYTIESPHAINITHKCMHNAHSKEIYTNYEGEIIHNVFDCTERAGIRWQDSICPPIVPLSKSCSMVIQAHNYDMDRTVYVTGHVRVRNDTGYVKVIFDALCWHALLYLFLPFIEIQYRL